MTSVIHRVAVVGLGTMGAGIVEVFARAGLDVVAVEVDAASLQRGRNHLADSTGRAMARGALTGAEQAALTGRVEFTTDLPALADVGLVVEAVPERLDLKHAIFARLDSVCSPATVLASNTSSLSVTELAAATGRPGRVIGLHFFNPAPVMKLVEIVRGELTEPGVVADVEALVRSLGKVGVTVGDRAGFVANALLFGYLNQAAAMVEDGGVSREEIDAAMRLAVGVPLGPLELLDLIGLDVGLEIMETLYRQTRERRHAPAPVLSRLVAAGLLGRKTGRGFYTYAGPGSGSVAADRDTPPSPATGAGASAGVRGIGVVGASHAAVALVQAATAAGFDVVHVADDDPGVTTPAELTVCDVVIEASGGDAESARARLGALDRMVEAPALLATTSGAGPVIDVAVAAGRPERVVGLHVPGPAPDAPVVEVVTTVVTDPAAEVLALNLVERLGRRAVRAPDRAGFVVDALLMPYLNDAVRMLERGYATADDIDAAMRFGCGYPVGPIALLDEIGLDVALSVQRRIHAEIGHAGLLPAVLLERLVSAGRIGRTTGRGLRSHNGSGES
ncbi:MAG: 3-hydroxyacyl-CoA dehydrogenase NAD-binding domain-containing protein [bacterium]